MENKPPFHRKLFRWGKRLFRWTIVFFLMFAAILLIGLLPVNNDFVPAKNGITLYVVSNAVHADVIVPVSTRIIDWNESFSGFDFTGDVSKETHVAFGWGDRGFFLETETWADLKLLTAANALLLPSKSCLHVSFTNPEYYRKLTAVNVSEEQYQRLVGFINETFQRDSAGKPIQIQGYAYSTTDAFFDARGQYHLFNTCNSWVGRALKVTGVRVPWLSPMPKSPLIYLDEQSIGK
ncbi:MAG: TIGR02117 family protein [Pirellulaceae bacterium]